MVGWGIVAVDSLGIAIVGGVVVVKSLDTVSRISAKKKKKASGQLKP